MPSQEELVRIIGEMRSQGLSDDEIRETLEDMGISSDVIESLIGAADKGGSNSLPEPSPPKTPKQSAADSPSDDLISKLPHSNDAASGPSSESKPSDDHIPENDAEPESKPSDELFSQPHPSKGDASSSPSESKTSEDLIPKNNPPSSTSSSPEPTHAADPSHSEDDFSASIAAPPIIEEESVPSEKIDEIHTKVDALHRTFSPDALRDDVVEVKEMLRELKSDIRDIMAMFLAIQKLLQEILDTDRSILLDLYEKSKK